MANPNIEIFVKKYISKIHPEHRYASFDYCYNYFRTTPYLTFDIEKSCLVLGFYLSSWGMYRGSSFLLQKSILWLEPVIQYINLIDKTVWDIDVDCYDEKHIKIILEMYRDISELLVPGNNQDLTLVTKILLGVFGFIPAFDKYFCDSLRANSNGKCGFRKLNEKSLLVIKSFYEENKTIIDKLSSETFTIDFSTKQATAINYPKAKIIDMFGFTEGLEKAKTSKILSPEVHINLLSK